MLLPSVGRVAGSVSCHATFPREPRAGRPWDDALGLPRAFPALVTSLRRAALLSAASAPLAGKRLEPIVHGTHFWFAWAAYRPKTRVYSPWRANHWCDFSPASRDC
jgi:hypothetical protein